MTDIVSLQVGKASSFDRDERTTDGFLVTLQVGPVVFEFWLTRRKK